MPKGLKNILLFGGTAKMRSRLERAINNGFSVQNIGDEQEDMQPLVDAAALCELAVVAVEGGKINDETRRRMKIASVLGIRDFLAVSDTGNSKPEQFAAFEKEFEELINRTVGETGGNSTGQSVVWQDDGRQLNEAISDLANQFQPAGVSFRMPVGSVSKTGQPSGTITSGVVKTGEPVVILPSAHRTTVVEIVQQADAGENVQLKLGDEMEIAVGDMICAADNPVEVADQFEATILWLSSAPMMAGRPYQLQSTSNRLDASITLLKYKINTETGEHLPANQLEQGEIGVGNISLSRRVPFEPCEAARETSRIEIFDKVSGETVGIGTLHFALRRASNVHWQALDVTRQTRAKLKGQNPAILWFTGLSGSGKSAIANIVEKKLTGLGRHTYTLDGDNIRHGLNRDLGFTDVDRVENIRRIGEVSRLMADSGLIVLVSFISPFAAERQLARELAEEGEFIEIYVDTPIEIAEARDIKGLYKKARAGEIKNFTGIDSPYEPPQNPEIRVDTIANSEEQAADIILKKLGEWGMIS